MLLYMPLVMVLGMLLCMPLGMLQSMQLYLRYALSGVLPCARVLSQCVCILWGVKSFARMHLAGL